jgi:pimeloyl-ACP methyl ester carboxylesterase
MRARMRRFIRSFLAVSCLGWTMSSVVFSHQEDDRLIDQKFLGGLINVRLSEPLTRGSKVLLGIPGGPGISGRYMDDITQTIAKRIGAVALVVDLPNHDGSGRLRRDGDLSYPEARSMLVDLLRELHQYGVEIVLFGHSMGAAIALDLLKTMAVPIKKTILISMPITWDGSEDFANFARSVAAEEESWPTEEEFKTWWKKVLPCYFYRKPTAHETELLAGRTFWISNESFAEDLPSATESAAFLKDKDLLKDILYMEGERELVLPKDNFARVKIALPGAEAHRLERTGHFPMLEDVPSFTNRVTSFLAAVVICSIQLEKMGNKE